MPTMDGDKHARDARDVRDASNGSDWTDSDCSDGDSSASDGSVAFGPRSFDDLLELLEALRRDSPRQPLAGMAFTVSPAQYLTLLQMDLPCDVGPSDYSCNILYYKSTTSVIHRVLVFFFAHFLQDQMKDLAKKHAILQQLLGSAFPFPVEVRDDNSAPTVDLTPDVAVHFPKHHTDLFRSPPLVVEVMYAHRFSLDKAEERYQQYFRAHDRSVKVVICLRLHYARGVNRAKKTAEKLDRSAVSVWRMDKDGNIHTVMR
jgi:hypothetical protein